MRNFCHNDCNYESGLHCKLNDMYRCIAIKLLLSFEQSSYIIAIYIIISQQKDY